MNSQLIAFNSSVGLPSYSTYTKDHKHASGMNKNEFQLKLLLWIMVEAWKKDYQFRIATKIVPADMFDDLVFHYVNASGGKYRLVRIIYVQRKPKPIDPRSLISPKHNCSLLKCFFSYQKTKNRAPFLGHDIQDVILFTNLVFNVRTSCSFCEKMDQDDDLFTGQRYKLTNEAVRILKVPLEKKLQMILEELAQCLADCIISPSKKGPQKEVLFDYIGILCSDVVDVSCKRFRPEFVSNSPQLTGGAKMFRSILETVLQSKLKSGDNLEVLAADTRINFKYFAKISPNQAQNFLPWPRVDDEEIQDFVDHLVLALGQPTEMALEEKIQEELAILHKNLPSRN